MTVVEGSNPGSPVKALDDPFRKLTRRRGSTLDGHSRALHRTLVEGVTVRVSQTTALAALRAGDPYPVWSACRSIMVDADEVHHIHNDVIDGYARHMLVTRRS